jgi:hypothetical protein
MKVQGVNNNQNNISHCAYFKFNKPYQTLYNNALKTKYLEKAKENFYKDLPNHELEILNIIKHKFFAIIEIKNNTTKVIQDWFVPDSVLTLEYLLNSLWLSKESYFFTAGEIKDSSFSNLVKKD